MADIAQLAGVSTTTVSHVVNKSRPVSPETEAAVLKAIAKTGYVADSIVRSQRTTGTQTIGLAMSAISNPYFSDVVHGLERAASQRGYSLLLADTHDDTHAELRAVSDLLTRRVEAIVLAPSADPAEATRHAQLQGVPVVYIDRLANAEVDQIGSENVESTARLVDHLAGIGHRRIAMISGREGLSTTEERLAGYRNGLRRNRIRAYGELQLSGHSDDVGAEKAFEKLMSLPRPPTAVVVGNNLMTIGAMRGARNLGIGVPEDLALTSFDDFEWADLFHPRLTVMAQPSLQMGEQAFELVMSRLANPTLPSRRIVMHTKFVHRDSCGCNLPRKPAGSTR